MGEKTNKTVLITGASSGIGAACAEVFAERGYRLAVGARRLQRLQEFRQAWLDKGAQDVFADTLDVTSQESVDEFVAGVNERFPDGVDVLINNAGLAAGKDPIGEGDMRDWQAMIDTNVTGLLRLTRRIVPSMVERKKGHVVNIGSIASHWTYAGGGVYAGTKHAVRAITGALRLELNGLPIRVSSVDPGAVKTEFSDVRLGDKEKAEAVYDGMTPLTGRDVAECVLFAAERPPHVNIDDLVLMPTDQASVYRMHRNK